MAITTLDGVIGGYTSWVQYRKASFTAEQIGVDHNPMNSAGFPAATGAPAPGINGAAVTSATTGFTTYLNAGAGQKYLTLVQGFVGAGVGSVSVYDILWWNSGLVVTTLTAQAIAPVAIPARDNNGTTDGEGVRAFIWVTTNTTNAAVIANTTISYTNSAGTAGRVGVCRSYPATAVAGTWIEIEMQAGDVGVRSVESVTLGTSYVAGVIHLVLARILAPAIVPMFGVGPANVQSDVTTNGMARTYNGTAIAVTINPSATAVGTNGISHNLQYKFSEG
jgi:hypothetical protein